MSRNEIVERHIEKLIDSIPELKTQDPCEGMRKEPIPWEKDEIERILKHFRGDFEEEKVVETKKESN